MIRRRTLVGSLGLSTVASIVAKGPEKHTLDLGAGFHLGEVINRTDADFGSLAAAGFRSVRFGIKLQINGSVSAFRFPAIELAHCERMLEMCQRYGLRMILVLRPPSEPNSEIWASELLQDSLANIWGETVTRLSKYKDVVAYDLVNEPHPRGGDFAAKERIWRALAVRLLTGIRRVDGDAVIIYEPSPGARPLAFRYTIPLEAERVVYSVHMYEPFEFTHQRIGDPRFPQVVEFPGSVPNQGFWDVKRLEQELAPVRAFQLKHKVHVNVGEFGTVRWAPVESRNLYISTCLDLFHRYNWSWHYHSYREWHGWDAEMGNVEHIRSRSAAEATFQILKRRAKERSS